MPLLGLLVTLVLLAGYVSWAAIRRDASADDVAVKLEIARTWDQIRNVLSDAEQAVLRYSISGDKQRLDDLENQLLSSVALLHYLAANGSEADRAFVAEIYETYLPQFDRALRDAEAGVAPGEPFAVPAALRSTVDERAQVADSDSEAAVTAFAAEARRQAEIEFVVMIAALSAAVYLGLAVRRASKREVHLEQAQTQLEREALERSERRFRALVQNSSDVTVVTDAVGIIQYASTDTAAVLGWDSQAIVDRSLKELVHPDDQKIARRAIQALLSDPHGPPESRVVRVAAGDDGWRHLEVRGANLLEEPAVNGLVLNIRDISDRVASAAARERLSAVVEATRDLVLVVDAKGRILDLNRAARKELAPVESVVGQSMFRLLPERVARSLLGNAIPAAVRNGSWEGEFHLPFGGEVDVTLEVEILAHQDGNGRVAFLSCLLRDVTERRRFEARLSYMATHDPLTGLGNRRYFEEYLARELGETLQTGRQGALLIVDLDGLKTVNDDLGHLAGDELLRGAAAIISGTIPSWAVSARIGGDEFAVLLRGEGPVGGMAAAERLRAAFRAARLDYGSEELSTTVSIGVAVMPAHGMNPEEILANADLAMYEAKTNRDSCRMFSPEAVHRSELSERRIWERRMRDALDNNGFVFMAQPVHEIGGEVVMYELLLRMEGGDGELVSPSLFLPIAERSGLVMQIDRFVVATAIEMIAKAAGHGRRVNLAVNISGRSLGDPELPHLIERGLRETGIDPETLVLEVTETAAIAGLEHGRRFVELLCSLGVRVAIDDFGAGFSSFAYIKTLPVTHVKIDGEFIRNVVSDREDQYIVRAMIEVAHGLGKEVVAEFVEDEATLELLRKFGVDMVQGYYLGQPEPVNQAIGVEVVRPAA